MASTTLTRTPSSAGNQKTWTLSAWVKNSYGGMFFCVDSYGATKSIQCDLYQGADYLEIAQYASGSGAWSLKTNRLFRDRNAWYHIVLSVDTTQATSSDRVKIYINGVRETSFSTETYPSQNYDTGANSAVTHMIGNRPSASIYFDGSMTHFHFIDGTAYDASTFGETDATTGIWKPKTAPSVTYGTNGFFLKFENSGSMGTDSSPNGNNFAVSGTLTQTVDTPSNVFATLNALDNYYAGATLSNGNTKSVTGTNPAQVLTTMGVSKGKWYWEVKATNLPSAYGTIGICPTSPTSTSNFISSRANEYMYYSAGNLYYFGGSTGTYASYTTGDIIGVAMDLDNNRLFFSKNGTWQNSADPTTSTGAYTITAPASTDTGLYFPAVGYWDTGSGTFECNFGNGYFGTTAVSSATSDESGLGIFEYTVPSGYYALCTKNINEQEYA
jgi:hypothetical protein